MVIKSASRGNVITEKTNLGKNLPNIDKNKTCSHGRNRNSRRNVATITTVINLKVQKVTSKIKKLKTKIKSKRDHIRNTN